VPPESPPDRPAEPHTEPGARDALGAQETPAWALTFVRILDDGLRIPGTNIGIGLDAILGFLFPGIGDAATGLASLALIVLAFQMRVPKVVLLRMMMNIAIDTLVGAIPIAGDAFDLFWRSNRKNLELIQRYDRSLDRRPSGADYLIVGLGILLALFVVILPVALSVALAVYLWQRISR
jgi:hypothetical protein